MNIRFMKNSITTFIFISFPLILCNTVYALTESEMQAAVDSQGKEAVSGNVFIWFLCAVAFLKISQKIDSFMSGLGVNVGHTGGSLMAEAMIAAKSLGVGGKGLLNKGFGGGSPSAGGSGEKGGFLSGGLAGVVGRNINNSAMNAATDKGGGLFGKKAFESSLKNSGDFAKDVIGKVAKGDIAKNGSITGETADKALSAYLGYNNSAPDLASAANDNNALIPTDTGSIETSADSLSPIETADSSSIDIQSETADSPGVSIQPETADSPGVGVKPETVDISDVGVQPEMADNFVSSLESGSEIASSAETDISAEGIPMESIPETSINSEMPESINQPDMQSGSSADIDSEQAALLNTGTSPAVGVQPETGTAGGSEAENNNEVNMNTGEQAAISQGNPQSGETPIPFSHSADDMPELPEIVPDYSSTENNAHPVTAIPDDQNSIPGYTAAGEAENVSSNIPASSDGAVAPIQPSNVSGSTAIESSVHTLPNVSQTESTNSSTPQPAERNSGAAPVSVTSAGPSVSGSNNQTQSNTVVNTSSNSISANAEVNSNAAVTQQEHMSGSVSMPADSPVTVPVSSENLVTAPISSESVGNLNGDNQLQSMNGNDLTQNAGSIPTFSNVEIGGGRILGTETSGKFPNGIEFGMYNTAQYMKPEGAFTTVTTVDGAKWYKQYAVDKVEKTPVIEGNGKIKYDEKIVKRMPPVPRRKDRV